MPGKSSIIPFGIGGRARQIIIRRATIFIVSRLIVAQRVQLKRKDTLKLYPNFVTICPSETQLTQTFVLTHFLNDSKILTEVKK